MRIAVVGATGNVGTSVLRALADAPEVESILGIARRRPALEAPKVEWAAADVERDDLVRLFRGADAVVHLAWLIQPARDLAALRRTNVYGSRRVFRAVARAEVRTLVYASSVGAYSPGPKDRSVDESWATDGVMSSFYSRHKAEVERILDGFEREHPEIRTVRLRPGLVFKRGAASGIRRLFIGPFLPSPLVRPELVRAVPDLPRLRFQAVHSLDLGEAFRQALARDVNGAFNVAADPVLDPAELGRVLGARPVPVPLRPLRSAVNATYSLRLQPTSTGWLDMALAVPVMDTRRAREELGWAPRRDSGEALLDLLEGIRTRAGLDTPPLAPGTGGCLRLGELRSGVGAR
jgi:nucleoside-diphosphate-sugar epimerase